MTAAVTSRPAPVVLAGKVTQARVVLSEWTKFRSLRSTMWTLLASVVLTIGLGALISAVSANAAGTDRGPAANGIDGVAISLAGTTFAQLAIGVLGVLLISGEYSTGMIRASLTAVPRRLPMLWAKLVVFAVVVFPVSLVTAFISFFLGQALLSGKDLSVSISDPGVLRSVIGSSLYVTVAGLIAMAIGGLLRHSAAGISAFVAVFFVIPPLATLLPASFSDHVDKFLPSNAGGAVWTLHQGSNQLSPWVGFGVLCLYAVVLVAAAGWRLLRTDA